MKDFEFWSCPSLLIRLQPQQLPVSVLHCGLDRGLDLCLDVSFVLQSKSSVFLTNADDLLTSTS